MVSIGHFCPTSYGNNWPQIGNNWSVGLTSAISSHGYCSLYNKNRQDFDQLEVRRESFLLFPPWSLRDVEGLARAGFYFTGDNDTTKCHSCHVEIWNWKSSDIPMDVHRRRSPNCQFINSYWELQQQQQHDPDSDSSDEEDCIETSAVSGGEQDSDSEEEDEIDGSYAVVGNSTLSEPRENRATVGTADSQFSSVKNVRSSCTPHAVPVKLDKVTLRRENDQMKSSITCRVCKKEQVQTLFLPCRHLIMCEKCSEQIDDCVLCKKRILGTVRTFLL